MDVLRPYLVKARHLAESCWEAVKRAFFLPPPEDDVVEDIFSITDEPFVEVYPPVALCHCYRVYVAGAYSGPDVITVLENMRRGLRAAALVQAAGFAPYAPWADCLVFWQQPFSIAAAYRASTAWLEVADAVLVVPEGAATSQGTQREIARAKELQIPVFDCPTVEESIQAMTKYFLEKEHKQRGVRYPDADEVL